VHCINEEKKEGREGGKEGEREEGQKGGREEGVREQEIKQPNC
jgi:hypothetical protein